VAARAVTTSGPDVQIGYKLATEAFGPKEIIRQAIAAEQASFDFVEMSDHYHPAIIAQAAATLAIVSDGRFTFGVGAGERLNEHVVGQGFPDRRRRHERFREALEIIRLLWRGSYRSYEGKYLQLEDARVFDLPEGLPVIAVAASGPASAKIAAELGDGLFATEPKGDPVDTWRRLGGSGPAQSRATPRAQPGPEPAG
jgi:G6PDH family F420-dependent oxidoreductase